MARSTRLVILIKNIYTLWSRKRFLLPVTYLPTNLVYPFTLRVTGIKIQIKDIVIRSGWFRLIYYFRLISPDSFKTKRLVCVETEGQTDMARSTRLVMLIKNIYTLCGRKRLLHYVVNF